MKISEIVKLESANEYYKNIRKDGQNLSEKWSQYAYLINNKGEFELRC